MSDDCNIITIKEPQLIIEFMPSNHFLVEIEREQSIIEMVNCNNNEFEINTESLAPEIIHQSNLVLEIERPEIVIEFPENITIVNEGDQLPSEDFEQVVCQFEAGGAIQVNRVVTMMADGRIKHADKDVAEDAKDVIGISTQSGAIGQLVKVVKFGRITGASFGNIADNFFLGSNGQIIDNPPSTGTWLNVGMQLSLSTFFVKIGEPIRRN